MIVPFNANIALSINVIDLDGAAAINPVTFGATTGILFNTGAGLKYTDMTAAAMHLHRPGTLPSSMPVGGIITPQ